METNNKMCLTYISRKCYAHRCRTLLISYFIELVFWYILNVKIFDILCNTNHSSLFFFFFFYPWESLYNNHLRNVWNSFCMYALKDMYHWTYCSWVTVYGFISFSSEHQFSKFSSLTKFFLINIGNGTWLNN